MNRQQMRADLAFTLGVREGEADQDFQTSRLNTALDRAYERVVLDGRNHGTHEWFFLLQELVWPVDTLNLELPRVLAAKQFIAITDVTDGEPGVELIESEDFRWRDYRTLQWGTGDDGPGSERTLHVSYDASAEPLLTDASEPLLVSAEHCAYIVWDAALNLRGVADDQIPSFWREQWQQARVAYIKHVSRPRPSTALALATSSLYEEDF